MSEKNQPKSLKDQIIAEFKMWKDHGEEHTGIPKHQLEKIEGSILLSVESLVTELQNRNQEDKIKVKGISIDNVYVISSEKLEGRIEGREEGLVLLDTKEPKKV